MRTKTNEAVEKRLGELSGFLRGGLRYRDWMQRKFEEHPDLITFPLEHVPDLIAKGVSASTLGSIVASDVGRSQHALDGFSFGVPFAITKTDAVGYWGDVHTASGRLVFHVGYNKENLLGINASYSAIGLVVYKGVPFTVANYQDVIPNYVHNLCNNLRNVKKVN